MPETPGNREAGMFQAGAYTRPHFTLNSVSEGYVLLISS